MCVCVCVCVRVNVCVCVSVCVCCWGKAQKTPGLLTGRDKHDGSGGRRTPFSQYTASYTHTDCSLARPLLTSYSLARPFCPGTIRPESANDACDEHWSSL